MGQVDTRVFRGTYHAAVNSAAADVEAVAAVTGKIIRVLSFDIGTDATAGTAIRFVSDGAGDTDLTGNMVTTAEVPRVVGHYHPGGHFQTLEGEALDIRQTTTDDIDGFLTYMLLDGGEPGVA